MALIKLGAVRSDYIGLFRRVGTPHEAISIASRRVAANGENVASARNPLALHAEQPGSQVEDEVVALAVRQWLEDADAEPDRRRNDLGLGNGTLPLPS
jgi:hypothetical protein